MVVFISVTMAEGSFASKEKKDVLMQISTKSPTKVQVAFSITSVVLRTPII